MGRVQFHCHADALETRGSHIVCICSGPPATDKEAGIWEEGEGRGWLVHHGVSEGLRATEHRAVEHCDIVLAGQSKDWLHSPHCCLVIPGDCEDVPSLVLSCLDLSREIPAGYGFIFPRTGIGSEQQDHFLDFPYQKDSTISVLGASYRHHVSSS